MKFLLGISQMKFSRWKPHGMWTIASAGHMEACRGKQIHPVASGEDRKHHILADCLTVNSVAQAGNTREIQMQGHRSCLCFKALRWIMEHPSDHSCGAAILQCTHISKYVLQYIKPEPALLDCRGHQNQHGAAASAASYLFHLHAVKALPECTGKFWSATVSHPNCHQSYLPPCRPSPRAPSLQTLFNSFSRRQCAAWSTCCLMAQQLRNPSEQPFWRSKHRSHCCLRLRSNCVSG